MPRYPGYSILIPPEDGNSDASGIEEKVKVEDPFLTAVMKIIEENMCEADFNVKKLASELNMSRPTFSFYFKPHGIIRTFSYLCLPKIVTRKIVKTYMFSGIVEECATLVAMVKDQENVHFTFKCSFVNELKIDQSVSHNGVCLTVVSMTDDTYTVTAMKETLERSNPGLLKVGDEVNVERSMMMNGRLDGHIVQGHVDQTAECIDIKDAEGSYYFTFRYAFDKEMAKRGYITVDKGSVTVNGVSLTVCNPTDNTFQVAIIPYTFEHTNFHTFKVGSVVNLEFDIIGKYISRLANCQASPSN